MSGTLFTLPRTTPVNSSGRPYAGATLTFYLSGTSTLASVYTNSALSVPSLNPLTASSAGQFSPVYLDPAITYRVVLKSSSGTVLADDSAVPGAAAQTAETVGAALYPVSSAESAAGVTPTYYQYPPGDSRRYATLALWAAVGGDLELVGNYTLTAPVTFPSGTTVRGVGLPTVTVQTAGVQAFQCENAEGFRLDGVRFVGAGAGVVFTSGFGGYEASASGLVAVADSSDVRITNCEFENAYNAISVLNCDRVWITGNTVSQWHLYGIVASLCSDFTIDHNTVIGCNQSGAVNAYGIMATGDEDGGNVQRACSISFNTIRDIPSWDGIMSHDVSGLRIIGNDIRNVRNGIDVGHVSADNFVSGVQIVGNYIESTTTNTWSSVAALHSGILVTGFDATHLIDSVTVSDNVIKGFFQTAGMVGSGSPSNISVAYSQYCTITGNVVRNAGNVISNAGVYVSGNNEGIVITGNTLQGTMAAGGVRFAGVTATGAVIEGNAVKQTTASDPGVYVTGSTLSGFALGRNGGNSTAPVTISTSTVTYAHRNTGATSVADGGTITHGMTVTPTKVTVTPSTASEFASVTAIGSTTFTVALKKHDNSAGTTAVVYWAAEA